MMIRQKQKTFELLLGKGVSESTLRRVPRVWIALEKSLFPAGPSASDEDMEKETTAGLSVFCACLVVVSDMTNELGKKTTFGTSFSRSDPSAKFECVGTFLPDYPENGDKRILLVPEEAAEKIPSDPEAFAQSREFLFAIMKERLGKGDFFADEARVSDEELETAGISNLEVETRVLADGILRFATNELIRAAAYSVFKREGLDMLRDFKTTATVKTEQGCMTWTVSHVSEPA